MNRLAIEKQAMAVGALVEGAASIRSVERMTGIHRDTIMRLMVRTGQNCEAIMHSTMKNLKCDNLQVDEIWCFVGKKQRHLSITDNIEELTDQIRRD